MTLQLYVLSGPCQGRSFRIPEGRRVTVGRSAQADVSIDDPEISRAHCSLENRGDWLYVTDLNSANGTFVDDFPVKIGAVDPSGTLRLGTVRISIRPASTGPDVALVRGGQAAQQHPTVTFGIRHALATGGEDATGTMRDQASLVALLRLTTALAARTDPEAIARAVAAAALPGCGCRRIALVLVPGGGAPWQHLAWTDGDEPGPPILVDTGIVETVLRTRQCLQVPACSHPGALLDHVLCAPLQARQAVLGVVWAEAPGDAEPPTDRQLAFLEAVGVQAGLAIDRDRLFSGLEEAYIGTIRSLVTALEIRDPYTRGHAERVTASALALGERMGLPPGELEALEIAGLLHDVGKVGMGEDLLHRTTPLTPDDRAALQHHADWGGEIVRNIRHPATSRIESAVRHHHEHWDGSGYPDGLAGEAIPLTARLLAVADTWDAMTSTRPYRDAMDPAHARRQLVQASGTQLDPAVVEEFLRWLDDGAPVPTHRGPRRSRYVPTSLTPLPAIPRPL